MAIVRLKRRISEEPVEALLLSCKRKCLEKGIHVTEDTPVSTSTVVQFAGTVKSQDENVVQHISKKLRDAPKAAYFHVPDFRSKLRDEVHAASQESRFKVVNCFRAIDVDAVTSDDGENASGLEQIKKPVTVFDVVRSDASLVDETSHSEDKPKEDGYAYDLYYVDMNDMLLENSVELEVYQKDLFFPRCNNDSCDTDNDSEDSNAESNWRNEYPDTEDSVDEDDMRAAVRMEKSSCDELSSSDENLLEMSGLSLDVGKGYHSGITRAFFKAVQKHDHSYACSAEDSDNEYSDYYNDSDE